MGGVSRSTRHAREEWVEAQGAPRKRPVSAHPRSSAICTARPEMWCVSRKGTPLRTRYLHEGEGAGKEGEGVEGCEGYWERA